MTELEGNRQWPKPSAILRYYEVEHVGKFSIYSIYCMCIMEISVGMCMFILEHLETMMMLYT